MGFGRLRLTFNGKLDPNKPVSNFKSDYDRNLAFSILLMRLCPWLNGMINK